MAAPAPAPAPALAENEPELRQHFMHYVLSTGMIHRHCQIAAHPTDTFNVFNTYSTDTIHKDKCHTKCIFELRKSY